MYFWPYPVFEAVGYGTVRLRYSGILHLDTDTARYERIMCWCVLVLLVIGECVMWCMGYFLLIYIYIYIIICYIIYFY